MPRAKKKVVDLAEEARQEALEEARLESLGEALTGAHEEQSMDDLAGSIGVTAEEPKSEEAKPSKAEAESDLGGGQGGVDAGAADTVGEAGGDDADVSVEPAEAAPEAASIPISDALKRSFTQGGGTVWTS